LLGVVTGPGMCVPFPSSATTPGRYMVVRKKRSAGSRGP
jgi:hypothetical protein